MTTFLSFKWPRQLLAVMNSRGNTQNDNLTVRLSAIKSSTLDSSSAANGCLVISSAMSTQ